MLQRKTVVDQIEITSGGFVQLRFAKLVVDGDKVVSKGYHRATVAPGDDFDALLKVVNAGLRHLGESEVEENPCQFSELGNGDVRDAIKRTHTSLVVSRFKESVAKEKARQGAR